MNQIDNPIESLDKIGKARTEKYHKLGINTISDLLYYIPRDYIDFRKYIPVSDAESGDTCVFRLKITGLLSPVKTKRMMIYKASATDGESDITVVIYNNFYAFDALQKNAVYYMYGKFYENTFGREIVSPQCIPEGDVLIQPKYRLTSGLTVNMIRANIKQSVEIMKNNPFETLPEYIIKVNNLCPVVYALENIHFPESMEASEISRKRLAFDEILSLQLNMALMKSNNKNHTANVMDRNLKITEFFENLPFEMTDGQKYALDEILNDLCRDIPMNRLLQGDVGSGKTAVAGGACYFAFKNGFQSAMMAPIEILASQHYVTLSMFLEPLGAHVCLLTSSVTAKNRREIKEKIKSGYFSVVVGTHAIIQKDVEFNSLGLVITDEQHRFGVGQRSALAEKGNFPHKLVMSATPIPRTLGLIIYGDLDVSVINQLPKGRKPVSTYAVTSRLRERTFSFVRKALNEGRQAYVVCPMIEESESDLNSVKTYYESAKNSFLKGYSIGILHGKLSAIEKESVMNDFKFGNIQVLICTTVVEVGVDVPNASVIVIENADRYGLSQLHQLRGRVGRGQYESSCILITDNLSEECKERMRIMCRTSNGFEISEYDLRLRGPGDFLGSRQHGLPPLKIADLECDMPMVERIQIVVKDILKKDPLLELPEHECLRNSMKSFFEGELIG